MPWGRNIERKEHKKSVRERIRAFCKEIFHERLPRRNKSDLIIYICVCVFIYIYMYIYMKTTLLGEVLLETADLHPACHISG